MEHGTGDCVNRHLRARLHLLLLRLWLNGLPHLPDYKWPVNVRAILESVPTSDAL